GSSARVRLDNKPGPIDTAQVCLNHKKHVDVPDGCRSCHQPDARGAYMAPISYAKHCAECHSLALDKDKSVAPHDTPEIVHAFLRTRYAELPEGGRAKARDVEARLFFKNDQGAECVLCHDLTAPGASKMIARCAEVTAGSPEGAAAIERLRSVLRDDR